VNRVAFTANQCIQSETDGLEYRAGHDDPQIVAGIRNALLARPAQSEQRMQKHEPDDGQQQGHSDQQNEGLPQNMLGFLPLAFS
jgi:hypothetical protein